MTSSALACLCGAFLHDRFEACLSTTTKATKQQRPLFLMDDGAFLCVLVSFYAAK